MRAREGALNQLAPRQANDAGEKNNFELKDKCGFSPDMHAGEGYSQAYTNDFSKFLPTVRRISKTVLKNIFVAALCP